MRSADHHEHAWAQARLELYRARLLEPDEDERVQAHARLCAACRDGLGMSRAGAPDAATGEHVPSSVLARWPGAAADLPTLERELVEQHLSDCEHCRDDLRVAATAATVAPSPRVVVRWERVWAIAATAAAASLAVTWWAAPLGPRGPSRQMAPDRASAEPRPMSAMPFTLAPSAVVLHDVTRSGGAAAAVLIEPGPREPVVLAVEPFDVPDSTPIAFEFVTRSGGTFARLSRTQAELYPHRQLVVGDASHPVADGDYVLRMIAWPGAANADTQSFALTVRRRH